MSPVGGGKATSDLWWKNAVVYCLDVESFHDADGDGCGDLTPFIDAFGTRVLPELAA